MRREIAVEGYLDEGESGVLPILLEPETVQASKTAEVVSPPVLSVGIEKVKETLRPVF